ncbi:MAG: bifunctional glutamate N-acetyltransferase/amino-acid acetyltransferase ArgJ [Hyphomicrobiales bacterium]|nr:bifunctional glutamate N-acetyltransferase/amino-acid acetyltransferase ArgJ [Hyphomicrobiales bacterium]
MSIPVSPLAPTQWPRLPPLAGVRLGCVEAGIKYQGRKDLTVIDFDEMASIAGVFTKSRCPSAPVDWCKNILATGKVRCIIVNSGNANAFTGNKGHEAVDQTTSAAADIFDCNLNEIYLASTGVIGEPLDAGGFSEYLKIAKSVASENAWEEAAKAIMTTDTYHKVATRQFIVDGQAYHINGIAKGSGMIAPDMATMLSFLVTDLPINNRVLQHELSRIIPKTFNSITVDSDTSTSDTVLLASTNAADENIITDKKDNRLRRFRRSLGEVLHELAMLVVRDGEGASKHIEICVEGATTSRSAKKIAMTIANSPLVKTAIAGQDANWGRIVMAVGKAGEPANRDLLSIWFGDLRVALNGERDPDYSEDTASQIMKCDYIPIKVSLGIAKGRAVVWTCDLTRQYVDINADYRS